jgi:hypothetical protein
MVADEHRRSLTGQVLFPDQFPAPQEQVHDAGEDMVEMIVHNSPRTR